MSWDDSTCSAAADPKLSLTGPGFISGELGQFTSSWEYKNVPFRLVATMCLGETRNFKGIFLRNSYKLAHISAFWAYTCKKTLAYIHPFYCYIQKSLFNENVHRTSALHQLGESWNQTKSMCSASWSRATAQATSCTGSSEILTVMTGSDALLYHSFTTYGQSWSLLTCSRTRVMPFLKTNCRGCWVWGRINIVQ